VRHAVRAMERARIVSIRGIKGDVELAVYD